MNGLSLDALEIVHERILEIGKVLSDGWYAGFVMITTCFVWLLKYLCK